MSKKEIWKDIPGYPGYKCSDKGRVTNLEGEIRSTQELKISLSKDGKKKKFKISVLVAMTFLGHIPDKFNKVVDHIDNDPTNNNLSNLQIITQRENLSKDKTDKTSVFTGVALSRDKWRVRIRIDGDKLHIGNFNSELEASRHYQIALENLKQYKGNAKAFRDIVKDKYSKLIKEEVVTVLEYANSQLAWEGVNEYFLNNSLEIMDKGGCRYGPQLIAYDMFIKIRKAWVDPNFDFGNMFGYRRQKWSSLVNNYINLDFLDILKSQVLEKIAKRSNSYNLSMQFDNSHGSGKNCLLSLTISQRVGIDHPIISFNLRSSEITKRLLWDLLLVQRVAEYIFGEEQYVSIQLFCGNMYQHTESFIMYDNHKRIRKMITAEKDNYDTWQQRTIDTLKQFKNVDPKTVGYKVHLRSVKQLQRPDGIPLSGDKPLLAGDCYIYEIDHTEYPDNCITKEQRKRYKAKLKRKAK